MLEIERKFIMEGFPEEILSEKKYEGAGLKLLREVDIRQGYISIEPEVRLHRAKDLWSLKDNFRLTLKGNGDLTRTEIMTDVSEEFYEEAKTMLPGAMIQKLYHKYQYGAYLLEVCRVDPGTENEFYYGEIEFASEEAAQAFVAPKWLGEDVTTDSRYKMKNYWKRTRL